MDVTNSAGAARAASADGARLSKKAWATREDQVLFRAARETWPRHRITAALPGRTAEAIYKRSRRLNIRVDVDEGRGVVAPVDLERNNEIRRLCGYMSSDASVAAYVGCTITEVTRIRENMPKPTAAYGRALIDKQASPNLPDTTSAAARDGCNALLVALRRAIRPYAAEYDLAPEVALTLFMGGRAAAQRQMTAAQAS